MTGRVFLPIVDNGLRLVRSTYTLCLLQALHKRPFASMLLSYPYPLGAMDLISNSFLKTDCERMLIIDGDMVFTPRDVDLILEHDVPIVGGVYAKKKVGLELCMSCESDDPWNKGDQKDWASPLVEVEWVGRGFFSVHRSVFERLAEGADSYELGGETILSLWGSMPGGHSEDRWLCEKWRSLGGKVFVDQRVTVGHEGSTVFPIPGTYAGSLTTPQN